MDNQNNELELMRQQLAILNKKLEGQEIVNDRLMREAMKNKMSWIKKFIWTEIIIVPISILIFLLIAVCFHLSFGPVVVVGILCVIDVVLDYKINKIGDEEFLQGNLTETATKLIRMKKLRVIQIAVEIPVLIIWAIWFSIDFFYHIPSEGSMHGVMVAGIIGGGIGGIIGAVVVYIILRKMQHTNDEVISQIQELTKE